MKRGARPDEVLCVGDFVEGVNGSIVALCKCTVFGPEIGLPQEYKRTGRLLHVRKLFRRV